MNDNVGTNNKNKRFDSILLGDNPFYGVDHLSHERARLGAAKNQSIENMIEVIESSYRAGITGMVVATRPKLDELVGILKKRSDIVDKLEFYPVMPYAQGYVLKLSEKGIVNTVLDIMKSGGIKNDLKMLTKGTFGFLKKDIYELFKIFVDVELIKLKNIKVNTIFLHPVLTDLALALGMSKVFETFKDHLEKNHGIKAGLCTKNFSYLVTRLNQWNLEIDSIMTSFNKAGFLMNPSRQDCEKALQSYKGHVIAMNILAGGYLRLDEAYEYILSLPKIRKIVIGTSSAERAKTTFELFSQAR